MDLKSDNRNTAFLTSEEMLRKISLNHPMQKVWINLNWQIRFSI